ncbi:hypothetical protein [Sphingomonas sp. G-3-2-10]|jgi:hypothetical protein|uniref:hypothetical protein n=1 Tax=Sphingomonas sp. G-3-2-10 TaxID=2728838 RepID=UPI00146A4833|nr:hypothetical protein [Sphingomonas sp. G-3-2-10]NML04778.1 hypothetical protein [Sphingomonas sp. G-3-2-10]
MQAIRTFSNEAAIMCASAFALLLATAISNFLRIDVDTGDATFGQYLGQFTLPAMPLALVALLLVLRSRAATTIVASFGTLYYIADWAMLTF